ncbi:hypothetical protein JYU15_00095 [bacterium AH-315-I18]|nr:hypothetical protein [bacterium AH-315-I18]
MVIVCFGLSILASGFTWAQSHRAPSHIVNITGSYHSIFLPHEPKTLSFRIVSPPPVTQNKRSESLTLAYQVRDFKKQLVCRGSQLVKYPGNQKNWVRLTVKLPSTHQVGWFRVHLTLQSDMPNEPTRTLTTSSVDIAVMPELRAGVTDRYFGISEQGGYSTSMPPFTQFTLPAMRRLGANTFRFFTGWDQMQSGPGATLDFGRMDRLLAAAEQAGIDVLPMLGRTPDFAADPDIEGRVKRSTARIPQWGHWKNFVEQMVRRYKGRIHNWEIWNEANAIGFWTGGHAEIYATFLSKTYDLIKQIDPQAKIALAGVSGVKTDWIQRVINAGGGPAIDVMNVHPYRFKEAFPELGSKEFAFGYGRHSLLEDLRRVRSLMIQMPATESGISRELWITEDGYNTSSSLKAPLHQAVSPVVQASLLVRTMTLARTEQVDRFYWWTLHSTYGGGFGLLGNQSTSFMPKPAFVAYAVLQRQMAGAQKVTLLQTKVKDLYVCRIDFPKTSTCVIWTPRDPQTIHLRSSSAITQTNLMGTVEKQIPRDQVIDVPISTLPIYLSWDRDQPFEPIAEKH